MPGVPEGWEYWLGVAVGVLVIIDSSRLAYRSLGRPVMARSNPYYRQLVRPNGTVMEWDVRWTRRTVIIMLVGAAFAVFSAAQMQ